MIIGMLMTLAIIGLLYAGPTFENTWVAVAIYGGLIVAAILAFWYSGRLSGGIADLILGGSGGKVKETYSLAEKYAAEHKYKDAVEVYRRAIEKDNKNPTPRLKLADLYYKLRSIDNSIRCMEEASQLPKGMSEAERCTVINRIADLYLHHKRDPASAVRVLRGIIEKYPAGKYAVYARERIVQIKKDA